MSAEEFWKDDPQLFVSYRTSFINKKIREKEEIDYKCWLQGLYNYDGNTKISTLLKQFISNMFASVFKGKIDTKKIETYPIKPYSELEKEKSTIKNKKEIENVTKYNEYQHSLSYFCSMKQRYIDKIKSERSDNIEQ